MRASTSERGETSMGGAPGKGKAGGGNKLFVDEGGGALTREGSALVGRAQRRRRRESKFFTGGEGRAPAREARALMREGPALVGGAPRKGEVGGEWKAIFFRTNQASH